MKAFDEDAANAWKFDVSRSCTDCRMNGDQGTNSFEFFTNCVGRFQAIHAPPGIELADLALGEFAYLDVQRLTHSRLRSSSRTLDSGTVCPRSH